MNQTKPNHVLVKGPEIFDNFRGMNVDKLVPKIVAAPVHQNGEPTYHTA